MFSTPQSRPAGYPPNRQPVTVGEEERDGRGTTSASTLGRPPSAGRHRPRGMRRRRRLAPAPATQGRGPSQSQDRRAALRGRRRAAPGTGRRRRPPSPRNLPCQDPLFFVSARTIKRHHHHHPCQPQKDGWKGRYPVVSNRPLHCAMQQRCHHASASARVSVCLLLQDLL